MSERKKWKTRGNEEEGIKREGEGRKREERPAATRGSEIGEGKGLFGRKE